MPIFKDSEMKRIRRLRLFTLLLALFAVTATARAVAAHPLGNFTISRYSAISLARDAVEVLYIVDMAEIPAFQERQSMDADKDQLTSPDEETAYVTALLPVLASNLILTVDGEPVLLTVDSHSLTFPPGQGDLPTLRLEVNLSAALPETEGERAVVYEDRNFAGRLGWQEIILSASEGAIADSTVPTADISNRLRDYPTDLLQAPLTVSRAEAHYSPTASPAATTESGETVTDGKVIAPNRFGQDEFADLLSRTLDTPTAVIAALLVAVGLGAAHALTPGHGKTIVGAYLVGSRGTARHALLLGVTTTITHTAGVFALGLLVLFASEFILPERLYPWLGVMSGLLVAGIGLSILRGHVQHWLAHRRGEAHDHGHYHFHFGKGHSHDHQADLTGFGKPVRSEAELTFVGVSGSTTAVPLQGHVHPHLVHDHHHAHDHRHDAHDQVQSAGDPEKLSLRNLLALGISGGLLPCPSALILMLSAIALRQVGTGLALILAFSIGLAAVLTGIGLIMVYAGRLLERVPIGHSVVTTRILPIASASFITGAGLLITVRALAEAGAI